MVVRTIIFSLNAHRNMKNVGLEQRRAASRLSSGYRINSAADDAAGLAISETMRAQIRGLDQASRNAQDGQAMLLTTEGGLEEIGNMLQRVRELLVQASNDTNTQDQRTMIEQEISQLATEIASMQQRVEFNTNRVLAMGPALDVAISQQIARIDNNNLILNAITDELNTNRAAVADAREMLALFNSTDVWSDLQGNTRLATVLEEALAQLNLGVSALGLPANVVANSWATNIAGQSITNVARIVPEHRALSFRMSAPAGTVAQQQVAMSVLRASAGARIASAAMASTSTVTDLIGLLNTRDTAIMNALGEVSSIRTQMTLAGRNIVTGTGDFVPSISHFRNETSSGNFVAFFQAGANANQGISYDFENVSRAVSAAAATVSTISALVATPSAGSGIGAGADVTQLIAWVQASLDDVNSVRANLGAVQNRMDYTMRSLDISSENLQDSESRVRNADMAREMMRFTMSNVLQQASISMLSQANQMPNNLLQILR